MNNIKTLKLKKILNLKEYLKEKRELDRLYDEYVQKAIQAGLEDVADGRVIDAEELHRKLEIKYNLTRR